MSLKLLLDEDIKSRILVRLLSEAGFDVATTADFGLDGQSDQAVLSRAVSEQCTLLTFNCNDFLRLHEQNPDHHGILAVYQERSKSMSWPEIVKAINNLVRANAEFPGQLHTLNQWRY